MRFGYPDGGVYCLRIRWFVGHILLNQIAAFGFSFYFVPGC